MPYPYTPPPFLQNQSADEIHRRMMNALPNDIDSSELNIPWDFTRPAAIEKAEFVQYELNETIKLMFPHWAYSDWLDLHAYLESITRKAANKATGHVTVRGLLGYTVPKGFLFATAANRSSSVIFEATEDITLGNGSHMIMDTSMPTPQALLQLDLKQTGSRPLSLTIKLSDDNPETGELLLQDGTEILERFVYPAIIGSSHATALMNVVAAQGSAHIALTQIADSTQPLAVVDQTVIGTTVPIRAVEGGRGGNVAPDTIILMAKPVSEINYITNSERTSGGAPEESDDELRERVLDAIRNGISWTGCDADYIRWAKEVPGVGNAAVDPEWDDPHLPEAFHWIDTNGQRRCAGAVRLFVIDANNTPANQQILDAVYEYIVNQSDRTRRRAPIGATVTVVAPVPLPINVSAKVYLSEGENLKTVIERFKTHLDRYWLQAATENDLYEVHTGVAQNYVKYVYIGATLAETAGIADYDHETLIVNGSMDNIPVGVSEFPVTGEVQLYE